jgi:hypothetical protein
MPYQPVDTQVHMLPTAITSTSSQISQQQLQISSAAPDTLTDQNKNTTESRKNSSHVRLHAHRAMCLRNDPSLCPTMKRPSSRRSYNLHSIRSNPIQSNPIETSQPNPVAPNPKSFKPSHSSPLQQAQAQQAHSPTPTARTGLRQPVCR